MTGPTMKRNDDGQRWFVPYLHQPQHPGPPIEEECPEHSGTRLTRILGGRWICEACVRQSSRPEPG
jgi:hypothetical protein